MTNFIIKNLGDQLRVDFPSEGGVLFFKGNEATLKNALSTSSLVKTGRFTRTGLEYLELASTASSSIKIKSAQDWADELAALGI